MNVHYLKNNHYISVFFIICLTAITNSTEAKKIVIGFKQTPILEQVTFTVVPTSDNELKLRIVGECEFCPEELTTDISTTTEISQRRLKANDFLKPIRTYTADYIAYNESTGVIHSIKLESK